MRVGQAICANYRGKEYKAWVRANGGIGLKGEVGPRLEVCELWAKGVIRTTLWAKYKG